MPKTQPPVSPTPGDYFLTPTATPDQLRSIEAIQQIEKITSQDYVPALEEAVRRLKERTSSKDDADNMM
ncbi:MAG: hypothetical protein COY40_00450 [Alphaproteobacteria bacterium CG_4_10_14_0_8_um_filter_53_9]|nr:MAG: hypothetical protein COY40_00450 [Alphaproteobacteria bacterium CG_4_10_14_0_8_um_filter_53_9]